MATIPSYLSYWGKSIPSKEGEFPRYHLLAHHSVDVAAVAGSLLTLVPRWREVFECIAGLRWEASVQVASCWAALHDVGKFSRVFQDKRPDVVEVIAGSRKAVRQGSPHGEAGYVALLRMVEEGAVWSCPGSPPVANRLIMAPWVRAAAGHHGGPPQGDVVARASWDNESLRAATDFVRDLTTILRVPQDCFASSDLSVIAQGVRRSSWLLAGIVVIADWLGSNTTYFPYETRPVSLEDRYEQSLNGAEAVVHASGLVGSYRRTIDLARLTLPSDTGSQQNVERIPIPEGPSLFIVENLPGAAELDSVFTLVARVLNAGRADGVYWALPTFATPHAIAARLQQLAFTVMEDGTEVVADSRARDVLVSRCGPVEGDATATHDYRRWVDDSKHAVLAPVAVGSIDQAMQAVLPVRYSAVRLVGLVRNLLVVDGAHACDSYQVSLLERLLEFQAAHGGSVLLTAAILPPRVRGLLEAAYLRGLGQVIPSSFASPCSPYPVVHVVSGSGVERVPCALPPRLDTFRVQCVSSDDHVTDKIVEASQAGRCTLWVRNTVQSAVEAARALRKRLGPGLVLLVHARFTAGDRERFEKELVQRFGPVGSARDRAGSVVVSSPVVEQSLDVDFDELVSDLCPMDRLLHRFGLLRRHARDLAGDRAKVDLRGPKEMYVLAPSVSAPGSGWLRELPGTSRVYADDGVLWRTLVALRRGVLPMSDVQDLAREVFEGATPAGLTTGGLRVKQEDAVLRGAGQDIRSRVDEGFSRAIRHGVPTRPHRPHTRVCLLFDPSRPDSGGPGGASWRNNLIEVPYVLQPLSVSNYDPWGPLPEDVVPLKVTPARSGWQGRVQLQTIGAPSPSTKTFLYDEDGFRLEPT